MRKLALRCGVGALVIVLGQTASSTAQDFPQPTEAHKQMARDVGVWEGKVQVWPAPGAPVDRSTGVETCEMLGGFWLVTEYEGSFGGAPFTGRSQMGYDPDTDEFVSTWIDSMAPLLFVSRGEYDVATNTLTLVGTGKDWATGGAEKQMKLVTHYLDDDHKTFEVFESTAGSDEWRKSMRIDYVRKK